MDEKRRGILAVVAAILAARKLAAAPLNSPMEMAAISDAVTRAKKILKEVESKN